MAEIQKADKNDSRFMRSAKLNYTRPLRDRRPDSNRHLIHPKELLSTVPPDVTISQRKTAGKSREMKIA